MGRWNFTSDASSNCAPARARSTGVLRAFEERMVEIAMNRATYPAAIQALIGELKRLPGIGPRSAERIALWMLQSRDARPLEISRVIREVHENIRACPRCGFFTTDALCEICSDA